MQGFWLTLGWGLASLLAVSVLVALVEYLRQGAAPPRAAESPLPRPVKVDLDLGTVGAAAEPKAASTPGDAESRVALTEVLERLQRASAEAPWIETTPMVLAPKTTDLEARPQNLPDNQPG